METTDLMSIICQNKYQSYGMICVKCGRCSLTVSQRKEINKFISYITNQKPTNETD